MCGVAATDAPSAGRRADCSVSLPVKSRSGHTHRPTTPRGACFKPLDLQLQQQQQQQCCSGQSPARSQRAAPVRCRLCQHRASARTSMAGQALSRTAEEGAEQQHAADRAQVSCVLPVMHWVRVPAFTACLPSVPVDIFVSCMRSQHVVLHSACVVHPRQCGCRNEGVGRSHRPPHSNPILPLPVLHISSD